MARDPVLLALIIADNVVPDPNSGKNFILGTINQLFANRTPTRVNQISIYVAVGDAHDCRQPTLEIVQLKDEKIIMKRELPPLPGKPARLDVMELAIGLGGVEFPEYGGYEFRLWMDGKFLGGRKFTVKQWPKNR